ncbi:MAG TPA: hypothetical protein VK348_04270 [Planctomycetota bacterium]|nr:hypothetical protein [Planctomycetota bacterium]
MLESNPDFEDVDDGLGWGKDPDPKEVEARRVLRRFFEDNPENVFFSRQLEVRNEKEFFHWVTNRALHELVKEGLVLNERRDFRTGKVNLMWHSSYRYYRRKASAVVKLLNEYADPNISAAIGLHGEAMVLEGFASLQFVMRGRNSNTFQDRAWTKSDHDLDFIFERDGVCYGVEVKNTLGYMDHDELLTKAAVSKELGLRPVFVTRMLPKNWIEELRKAGGFALILAHQLYPWTHRELAKRVADVFGLPVDAPRRLYEATMQRFLKWHQKAVNPSGDSH